MRDKFADVIFEEGKKDKKDYLGTPINFLENG